MKSKAGSEPVDPPEPVVVGPAVRIRGKVRGGEDVVLRGQIEGSLALPAHHFTIDPSALVVGDVEARQVTVRGEHAGDAHVSESIHLDAGARVLGDVTTPRLVVTDGAKFKGRVDMPVDLPEGLELKLRS